MKIHVERRQQMECAAGAALSSLRITGQRGIGPVLDLVRDPKRGNSLALQKGFTRIELLALLGALALLAQFAVPVLAGSRLRSDRVICANNLRQIGAAMQLWGNDHNDLVPQEVSLADGGTQAHALAVNVWLHFSWISNELGSAQVLFCPSDQGRPARDFTADPNGGYLHPNLRNSATSYFLSHASAFSTVDLLAGDRNVGSAGPASCSRFGSSRAVTIQPPSPGFSWGTNLHDAFGNLLFFDGRVAQSTSPELRDYLQSLARFVDNGSLHYISPR